MKLPRFNENSYAHFITIKTHNNKLVFINEKLCVILINNFNYYRRQLHFKLLAYVIMPDHIHAIIWWNADKYQELNISRILRSIKSHTAREIIDLYAGSRGPLTSAVNICLGQVTQTTRKKYPHRRISEQKYRLWQPSFYDFNIYSEEKLRQKLNYIHLNPVRTGLVNKPEDYPYSSYRNYYLNDEKIIKIDHL
jgi:putative transposase